MFYTKHFLLRSNQSERSFQRALFAYVGVAVTANPSEHARCERRSAERGVRHDIASGQKSVNDGFDRNRTHRAGVHLDLVRPVLLNRFRLRQAYRSDWRVRENHRLQQHRRGTAHDTHIRITVTLLVESCDGMMEGLPLWLRSFSQVPIKHEWYNTTTGDARHDTHSVPGIY